MGQHASIPVPRIERFAEIVAVAGNLLYTFLYLNENPWCYLFALIGSIAFAWLCYRRKILAESGLHIFYILMAVYGYLGISTDWSSGSWTVVQHLCAIAVAAAMTFFLAKTLRNRTESKKPLLDSFTTIFSVLATWLMVNYVHENWLYWIVIDAAAIYLYINRRMYLGAGLFALYCLMAIDGFFQIGIFF